MIGISELKEKLGKYPDNYLVTAMELDENSILAIYDPKHEPVGYICTAPGLSLFNGKFVLAMDETFDKVGAL